MHTVKGVRKLKSGYKRADRYRHASKAAVENAHVDPAFRAVMEDRMLELGTHFGIEDFFSGWFRDAPFETIRSAQPDSRSCCAVRAVLSAQPAGPLSFVHLT